MTTIILLGLNALRVREIEQNKEVSQKRLEAESLVEQSNDREDIEDDTSDAEERHQVVADGFERRERVDRVCGTG